jgi:predicted DCC family thiol-disulfide oxidoreductase YuxK
MEIDYSLFIANEEFRGSIIIFDGICNLCNKFVNFIIDRDSKMYFKFATSQSKFGQAIFQKFHLSSIPETIVLIEAGQCYMRSDAVLKVIMRLDGFWPLLHSLKLIPRPIRDAVYSLIARNRYRWMGKQEVCRIPTVEVQKRFLS